MAQLAQMDERLVNIGESSFGILALKPFLRPIPGARQWLARPKSFSSGEVPIIRGRFSPRMGGKQVPTNPPEKILRLFRGRFVVHRWRTGHLKRSCSA